MGDAICAGASTLVAGNIKSGVTIFGVTGTFSGWVDNPLTIWNGSTAYYGCSVSWGADGTYRTRTNTKYNLTEARASSYKNQPVWLNVIAPSMAITVKKVTVCVYIVGDASDSDGVNGFTVTGSITSNGKSVRFATDSWWSATERASCAIDGEYNVTDTTVCAAITSILATRSTTATAMRVMASNSSGDSPSTSICVRWIRFWQ